MPLSERAALLIPSGPHHDPNKKHLHAVCTDPDADGYVLVVGIASYTSDLCDQTCVLQQHEHSWLNRQSYVLYRKAGILLAAALHAKILNGEVVRQPDFNAQVFLRIKNGVCRSKQTPRKIKRYLNRL